MRGIHYSKVPDPRHEKMISELLASKDKFEIANLIAKLRSYRRWEKEHNSFKDFCTERLKIGKTQAYKALRVAEFMSALPHLLKAKVKTYNHAVDISSEPQSKWEEKLNSHYDPEDRRVFQIYVLRCRSTGFVKIGVTCRLENRIKSIQTMCPTTLDLFRVFTVFESVSIRSEKFLHAKFSEYRKHGEWFDLPEHELEWLKTVSESSIHEN